MPALDGEKHAAILNVYAKYKIIIDSLVLNGTCFDDFQ